MFLSRFELLESLPPPLQRIHLLVALQLQQQRRSLRSGAQQFDRFFPVDGSLSRPEVRILNFGIVVNVRRPDLLPHNLEGLAHRTHHMSVSEIEADADVFEVRALDRKSTRLN